MDTSHENRSVTGREPSLRRWALLAATFLAIASHAPAVRGDFVYDDQRQIVDNYMIQDPRFYANALTSDVWAFKAAGGESVSNYFRPVFVAALIAEHRTFGLEPVGWHVANLVLHASAVVLLFLVLEGLGLSLGVTAVTCWAFAAHPAHVESVAWISGLPDLLLAVFGLASLLSYRWAVRRRSWGPWALSTMLFALALGSKESALGLLPIYALISLCEEPASAKRKQRLSRALLHTVLFVLAAVAFFALRASMLRNSGMFTSGAVGPFGTLLTAPYLLLFYLRQALVPLWFAPAYGLRPIASFGEHVSAVMGSVVGVLAIAWAVVRLARLHRAGWVLLALFVFPLLPALNVMVLHPEHIARDRYLYLPLAGILGLLAIGIEKLLDSRQLAAKPRGAVVALAGALSLIFAAYSASYATVWRSDLSLWEAGSKADPSSYTAATQYAEALRKAGRYEQALAEAKRGLSIAPGEPHLTTILGYCNERLGNLAEAIRHYSRVIETGRDIGMAAGRLAQIHASLHRFDEAENALRAAAEKDPRDRLLHLRNLAVILVQAGKPEAALQLLESVEDELRSAERPDVIISWFHLAELRFGVGDYSRARDAYRSFLERARGSQNADLRAAAEKASARLRMLGGDP